MSSSRNNRTYAKHTNREEWMCQNEDRMREFWNAMMIFLEHNNSWLLNTCTYDALCNFIADNSSHYDDRD